MNNVSIKGILIGFVALVVVDTLGDFLLIFIMQGSLSGEAFSEVSTMPLYWVLRMVVALVALIAGGYITARLAKSSFYINSGIVGVLSFIITILVYSDTWPLWFGVMSVLTQIPFAMMGGYLMSRKTKGEKPLATEDQ
jgi:nicotinamide riboside transporter PnuC